MAEKQKEKERRIAVVRELPLQPIRVVLTGEEEYECLTIEEAMTEIVENTRKILKALG